MGVKPRPRIHRKLRRRDPSLNAGGRHEPDPVQMSSKIE